MTSKTKNPKKDLNKTQDLKPARFLDPQNDAAFKKVFASAGNKDLLISLLNGLLRREGEELIEDAEVLNVERTPHINKGKKSF